MGAAVAAVVIPEYFIFPFLALYTLLGVGRAVGMGLLERLPDQDPLLDENGSEDEAAAEIRSLDYGELAPGRYPPGRPNDEPSENEP